MSSDATNRITGSAVSFERTNGEAPAFRESPWRTAYKVIRNGEAAGEPASYDRFQREDRYIVIKRSHLAPADERAITQATPPYGRVEAVVVEADWPEYELVWKMLEERVRSERAAALRPEQPRPGETVVYRGWEAAWNPEADKWSADGWEAYRGGCDENTPRVSASSWDALLDEIDEMEVSA